MGMRTPWLSRLSNWPRNPGGAIAGALTAIGSVLAYFLDLPLFQTLTGLLMLAAVAWAVAAPRSED